MKDGAWRRHETETLLERRLDLITAQQSLNGQGHSLNMCIFTNAVVKRHETELLSFFSELLLCTSMKDPGQFNMPTSTQLLALHV